MISIDDLVTPVTATQQNETFLSALERVGLKARSWREGGALRTIIRIVASTFAAFSSLQAAFIRGLFLELAIGVWLTLLAYYVYGVTRRAATFATGQATLTNVGGLSITFQIGQLRIINPTTTKAYTNAEIVVMLPVSAVSFAIVAVEIGSASTATANTITQLETLYDGVSVTNAAPVIGLDEALDPELRQLCKDALAARSVFGPRGAYAYAVRSALRLDGTEVNLNRLSISPGSSNGTVTIVVASPAGTPDAGDVTLVAANCDLVARPDTVTVNVTGALTTPVSRDLIVWAKKTDGLAASDLAALALAKLLELNRDYPIGGIRKATTQGYLYASTLDGVAKSAHDAIYAVDGLGTDVALAFDHVAVLSATVAVRIVDPEVHT